MSHMRPGGLGAAPECMQRGAAERQSNPEPTVSARGANVGPKQWDSSQGGRLNLLLERA